MSSVNFDIFNVIQSYTNRPIVYGESDCCQFAADCIEAITGVDYRPVFGRYSSEREAKRLMVKYGGIAGLLTHVLGEPNGDSSGAGVATTTQDGREMAGVIYKGRLVVRTENDLTDWPIELAEKVWGLCHQQ